MRVRVLWSLIVIALLVGAGLWVLRTTPLGQSPALGSPVPSGAVGDGGWTDGDAAPIARLEMGTAVHGGRIWLAGGLEASGAATAAVAIFDPATGDWTDGPPLPSAVHHAALVSDGERLLLVGGYAAPEFGPTDQVWQLVGDGWEPGPSLPEPRGAGAAAFDGERVLFGGGVGPAGLADDVVALVDDRWQPVAVLSRPREHLAATADGNGATWFLGGRQGGLETNVGDVDLVVGDVIRPLSPVTPRGGVAAFFAPGIGACLGGGEAPIRATSVVECVDADGRLTAMPPMRQLRHGHGAAVVDGVAWALLGGPAPGLSVQASVESLALAR
jgi:hypothetical protein